MQKYKRAKGLLAGTFGILYFYRAKARERGPSGASVHGGGLSKSAAHPSRAKARERGPSGASVHGGGLSKSAAHPSRAKARERGPSGASVHGEERPIYKEEEISMPVEVKVTLDVESMSEFMIYHIYTSRVGAFLLALGALNVGLAVAFALHGEAMLTLVFAVFAILVFFGMPASIKSRVASMKDSRRMTESVTYEFSEEGIKTTTSEKTGKASWGKFQKAISKKHILILYDDKKNAIILPIAQLGEKYQQIIDIITAQMPENAVRIKRK